MAGYVEWKIRLADRAVELVLGDQSTLLDSEGCHLLGLALLGAEQALLNLERQADDERRHEQRGIRE